MSRHIARKRFGQNFLIDRQIIGEIVRAISPQYDDFVVEIGPGLGALTEPLLDRIGHLHVIEIDRDIVARLRRQHSSERLTIHEGDVLGFDFDALALKAKKKMRIVGNLPYNISTPLLFHLASSANHVHDMHFMLQKEVVERLVAEPGTADYGRLSVMMQYRFMMDRLLDVPPDSFDPAPQVDSAVIRLIPLPPGELTVRNEELFSAIVAAAFGQRRKMLRNTLKGFVNETVYMKLEILPTARAEELTVADYVRLTNAIAR